MEILNTIFNLILYVFFSFSLTSIVFLIIETIAYNLKWDIKTIGYIIVMGFICFCILLKIKQ